MRAVLAACLLAVPFAAAPRPASALEAGRFAVVKNHVTSLKPGSQTPEPALVGGRILVDEQETTGAASGAEMTFGDAAVIGIGSETTFKVSREAIDEVTGARLSGIDLILGKVRVFVSRFLSSGREIRVNAPSAVVGIKGSEVVVQVLRDGTVMVTVISGAAEVAPRNNPGAKREVGAMKGVTVSPGTGVVGSPQPIFPEDVVSARSGTDPVPQTDQPLPGEFPTQSVPAALTAGIAPPGMSEASLATLTAGPSSQGPVMGSPATAASPVPMTTEICRCR